MCIWAMPEGLNRPLTPEALVNDRQKRNTERQQKAGKKKGQKKKAGNQNRSFLRPDEKR